MEIGNLNQRITILEHRTVIDEIGNHTTKWEETFSLWAKVTVKTATETTDAGDNQRGAKTGVSGSTESPSLNINSTNFRILFRNNILSTVRIVINWHIYWRKAMPSVAEVGYPANRTLLLRKKTVYSCWSI